MFLSIIYSPIFLSVASAMAIAQILKTLFDYARDGHFHWQSLFRGAGMPSSHTATVTALTLSVFLKEGVGTLSIVTLFLSGIIIRDVIGDKVFALHQERMINKIIEQMVKHEKVEWHNLTGHTIIEVIAGLILGTVVTLVIFFK
jgi:hypothetical protein